LIINSPSYFSNKSNFETTADILFLNSVFQETEIKMETVEAAVADSQPGETGSSIVMMMCLRTQVKGCLVC